VDHLSHCSIKEIHAENERWKNKCRIPDDGMIHFQIAFRPTNWQ
jgi:hypothetical protein